MRIRPVLLLLFLSLLSLPAVLAANPFQKLFQGGRNFLELTKNYADSTLFFILFTILISIFWIGITVLGQKQAWTNEHKNAMWATAIALAFGTSIPLTIWLTKLGIPTVIENLAKSVFVLIIIAVASILGAVVYRANTGEKSKSIPYIIAVAIILLNNLFSRDLLYGPNWTEGLGDGLGTVLDVIIILSWILIIIVLGRYIFGVFSQLSGSFRRTTSSTAATTGTSPSATTAGKKKKAVKTLERVLARALRKAYKYTRKMDQDIVKAHTESLKNPSNRAKIAADLDEAKKFRGNTVDIDALITETIDKVDQIIASNPTLATRLTTLNRMIQKELENIKNRLNGWSTIRAISLPAYLASAKTSGEKIEQEILGLEADVKNVTKYL